MCSSLWFCVENSEAPKSDTGRPPQRKHKYKVNQLCVTLRRLPLYLLRIETETIINSILIEDFCWNILLRTHYLAYFFIQSRLSFRVMQKTKYRPAKCVGGWCCSSDEQISCELQQLSFLQLWSQKVFMNSLCNFAKEKMLEIFWVNSKFWCESLCQSIIEY